jgi:hypothetical protein
MDKTTETTGEQYEAMNSAGFSGIPETPYPHTDEGIKDKIIPFI